MIEIISHRGYWLADEEKNTVKAFERSFSLGYGTETDLRDYKGEIVISHDIANEKCITFKDFLDIYNKNSCKGVLALNVKSDGLQEKIKLDLKSSGVDNYFLFDMSVPDLKKSLMADLNCFTRLSDVEMTPSYLEACDGVWIDSMESEWLDASKIKEVLQLNKKLCFVSSELHKREYNQLWELLKSFKNLRDFVLCTDLPEHASKYLGI